MVVPANGTSSMKLPVNKEPIKQVRKFIYLDSMIEEHLSPGADLKVATARWKDSFWRHKELMRNNLSLELKKKLLKAQVWSIVRYACFHAY